MLDSRALAAQRVARPAPAPRNGLRAHRLYANKRASGVLQKRDSFSAD
jgi:hypothetical protein